MTALQIDAYAASDVGLVRQGNEDSFYRGTTVFAVADGMGGHLAGEVASKTAIEPLYDIDGTAFDDAEQAEAALVSAIRRANDTVVSEAIANPDYRGMGTTLTAVMVRDGRLHLAHVGDSRAYLLRPDDGITQLTTDHTLVEQLIQEGRLSREEAAVHPQRSVITRAIGVDADVEVDAFPPIVLQPGDQVLLCSDGLTGPVDDDAIADILLDTPDGQQACEHLVNAANDAGGPDNITVVLLRTAAEAPGRGAAGPAAAHHGHAPTAMAQGGSAVTDVQREQQTQDLGRPIPAAPGEVHRIHTRDEPRGDWASSMGRYGDQQGATPATGTPRRARGKRALLGLLAALLVVGLIAGAGWLVLSRTYFVGVADGRVAVYNGLPQDVATLPLYWLTERSDVPVNQLQPRIRSALEAGITVGSLTEARRTVADYRSDVEGGGASGAAASGTSSPGTSTSGTSGEPTDETTPQPTDDATP